jgi:ABC-type branched-subunit amino acid transport system ATPase component
MPVHDRLALGIGYLPQRGSLFPSLTVEENLIAAGCLRGEGRAGRRRRLAAAYGVFPAVLRNRQRPAGALSGGQQQQVAMAKVWMQDPSLILLDEPSAGLSADWMDPVRNTIGALCAGSRAMLMVEQNVAFALALCTRVCFLDFGRIVFDGTPAQWRNNRFSKTLLWGDLGHAETKRSQKAS